MPTVSEALGQFLAETGAGDSNSPVSASSIVKLFRECYEEWGWMGFDPFHPAGDQIKPGRDLPVSDRFPVELINPLFILLFVNDNLVREFESDHASAEAGREVVANLVAWLVKKGYWDAERRGDLCSPVAAQLCADLCGKMAFARALYAYTRGHPVRCPAKPLGGDRYEGRFLICKVEPGKLHLHYCGDMSIHRHVSTDWESVDYARLDVDAVLDLPCDITDKAQRGWEFDMRIARIDGRWRVVEMEQFD